MMFETSKTLLEGAIESTRVSKNSIGKCTEPSFELLVLDWKQMVKSEFHTFQVDRNQSYSMQHIPRFILNDVWNFQTITGRNNRVNTGE